MALRGYIDGLIGGEVVGWALDDELPGQRLRVTGSLDGRALETVVADELRGDLMTAGFIDGAHGFRIPFDVRHITPGSHLVDVSVVGRDESLPLADDWVVHGDGDAPIAGVLLRTADEPTSTVEESPASAVEEAVAELPEQSRPSGPEVALVGSGGWLFAVPAVGLDALRGHARIAHAALDADVAAVEAFYELAASVGAVACVAELPGKLQVYAEHLPSGLTVDRDGRWARRLAARLRDSDRADVLDLYDVLVDARIHGRVFSRTGRSLTWVGAFHAYRAIARQLAVRLPALAPPAVADVELGPLEPVPDTLADGPLAVWVDGDVVRIDGLARPIPADEEPILELGDTVASGKDLPAGLVVHDGGGARITTLLGDHFSRTAVVVAGGVEESVVRSARPDAIVWVRGDR
ncbi:MAG: hypothetical protein JWN32_145 [Solirubrobacterales bacterium]|nr:hypothetical protein [Solirubrobacterales bacterium]